MRENYYLTFDEANGAANMRNYDNGRFVGGWYVKRHYRREYGGCLNGTITGYWYSIHRRRMSRPAKRIAK